MLASVIAFFLLAVPGTHAVSDQLVWSVDDVRIDEVNVDKGLYGVTVPGFEDSGEDLVLLPGKTVILPVPPGESFSVTVVPTGVRSLGAAPAIASMVLDENGYETHTATDLSLLHSSWGEVTGSGTFRRAGYVSVRLHPVIVENGELLTVSSLEIDLDFSTGSRPRTVHGHEGEIFQSVFGTDEVWREPLSPRAESPFWGKPWAKIQVDTAGVFVVGAELIPEAVGMPSTSFSMITGRGRMMNEENPSDDAFIPRDVPVFVDDGGDGTFDGSDRIIFYGRGLSWWGEFQSDHFNSRYSSENSYWLTWGGQGGPFMDVLDGSLTGAPSAGTSYTNRLHFEQNIVLAPSFNTFDDLFAWHRISSSGSATANYSFSSPGTTGEGSIRINMNIQNGSRLRFTATVNGDYMADTLRTSAGSTLWEFPVSGLKSSGNSLALRIEDQSSSRSPFVVYTDWIEVFPETDFKSWSSQCEVPLDRASFPTGERRGVSWAQQLSTSSFVCVALSDTAVAMVDFPGGKDFEIEIPEGWRESVMWVVPSGGFREPLSVTSCYPGRIVETLSAGSAVYIYPDEYAADMPLFERGRSDEEVQFLSLTEIYDEFNGGVRDPGAIRAFMNFTLRHWNNPPDQLVLVGTGHFDPRGFTTAKA
ncbi:MAG: hypothetical protein GY852_06335, partial [bacterium]|nr:hypothetical protein [bacterium]